MLFLAPQYPASIRSAGSHVGNDSSSSARVTEEGTIFLAPAIFAASMIFEAYWSSSSLGLCEHGVQEDAMKAAYRGSASIRVIVVAFDQAGAYGGEVLR